MLRNPINLNFQLFYYAIHQGILGDKKVDEFYITLYIYITINKIMNFVYSNFIIVD